jgi:hypothetical protein
VTGNRRIGGKKGVLLYRILGGGGVTISREHCNSLKVTFKSRNLPKKVRILIYQTCENSIFYSPNSQKCELGNRSNSPFGR